MTGLIICIVVGYAVAAIITGTVLVQTRKFDPEYDLKELVLWSTLWWATVIVLVTKWVVNRPEAWLAYLATRTVRKRNAELAKERHLTALAEERAKRAALGQK